AARLDHVPRPVDVDAVQLGRRRGVAVERRDVHDRVAAEDRTPETFPVEQVDPLRPDNVPGGTKLARDVPADQAASPRDVEVHSSHFRTCFAAVISGRVGTFEVELEVRGPERERFESIEALVDTGSTFTVLPSALLRRLGITPHTRASFVLADGNEVEL